MTYQGHAEFNPEPGFFSSLQAKIVKILRCIPHLAQNGARENVKYIPKSCCTGAGLWYIPRSVSRGREAVTLVNH